MVFHFPTAVLSTSRHENVFKTLRKNNFQPIILNLARLSSKYKTNIFRYAKFLKSDSKEVGTETNQARREQPSQKPS